MRTFLRSAFAGIVSVLSAVVFAPAVHAQVRTSYEGLNLGSNDPEVIVLNIIAWFLGILVLIAVVLIIYGGWLYMSSAGDEEKVERAKQVLKNAIIGLLIILSAWGLTLWLIGIFSDATGTGTDGNGSDGSGCLGCSVPTSGSSFYVLSTNPEFSETGVLLCTDVTVRMSDNVDQTTVTNDSFFVEIVDGASAGASCSVNTDCASSLCTDSVCVGNTLAGDIGFGPGDSTSYFNFIPDASLEIDTTYQATVFGTVDGVLSLDSTDDDVDDRIAMTSSYEWVFTTGSDTDVTPPTVEVGGSSPFPADGEVDVCLNTVVNFDFSEAMRISTFNDDTSFILDAADTTLPDWSDPQALTGWSFGGDFDYAQARPATELASNSVYGTRLYGGDASNDFDGALTDSCGNALDGDADGIAEGSTVDNYEGYDAALGETEDPVMWTTGENSECTPIIESFSPSSDYYGEYAGGREGDACTVNSDCGSNSCVSGICEGYGDTTLTLTGVYLGPHPEVEMEGSVVYASDSFNTCFDSDHLGNVETNTSAGDSCLDDELQETTAIVMRTPVGAADTTPIYVTVAGETSAPSATDLNVLSPYISALSPNNGSVGQYVTIVGANFSEDQGSGSVRMVSADGSRVSTLVLPTACGDTWDNDSIIVVAPQTYTNTDGSTGNWADGDIAYVQVQNSAGDFSDLQTFTFNTISRPNLCSVVDSCDDSASSDFYVTGDNFGDSMGTDDTIAFALDGDTGYNASITSSAWTDTRIDGTTSSYMTQDGYWVSVYDGDSEQSSNAVQYDVPCNAAPQVVNITTCDADTDVYPVPNPRPNTTDACINANIGVLFDQLMDRSTITTSNISLDQYNTGDTFDSTYGPLPVFAHMNTDHWTYDYGDESYYGFQLNVDRTPTDADQDGVEDGASSSSNLQPNTWYQLIITTGVTNTSGVGLAETYTMEFKTRDSSELCTVATIDVQPNSSTQNAYWDTILSDRVSEEYIGTPYDSTCSLLDPDSYSWGWTIDDTTVGDFGSGAGSVSNQNVYVAGNDAENEGTANVTADVDSITDTATFTVDLGYCDTDSDCSATCSGSVCNEESHECSPVIESINPTSGDNGTWVTIGGCMFGSTRGTVTMYATDGSIEAETEWPDETLCGDTWTNESVVIEVPDQYDADSDGTRDTELGEGTYNFGLAIPSGLSNTSTDIYTLDSVSHPGVCLIDPDTAANGGGVTVYGQGLGATEGLATFLGADDYDLDGSPDRVSAAVGDTSWSDSTIDTLVPTSAVTGDDLDGFKAVIDGGDATCASDDPTCSNGLNFYVSCTADADCPSGVCSESGLCLPEEPGEGECTTDDDCQVGSCGESTCTEAGICTPVVTSLEDNSGPNGGYTTVTGCYFGSYGVGSSVNFLNDSGATSYGAMVCSDSWSDTQIVVGIPSAADLPLGTTADVSVTTTDSLTSNSDVFTVTNTCSNGASVPSTGIPLLCDLLPSTGRAAYETTPGDTITYTGENETAGTQFNYFYNGAEADNFTYVDDTSTTAEVPDDALPGAAYFSVDACASNGLYFGTTCEVAEDCADGAYCVDGLCTSDVEDTCGSCTSGTSDAVCGTTQGCYYDSGEAGYCCGSRPTMESLSFDDGDTNVCPNALFVATFSEAMTNKEAITLNAVTDNGDGTYTTGSPVTIAISENADSTSFSITPSSLSVSTLYMLTITSDADLTAANLNSVSTGLSLEEGTQTFVFTTASSTCEPTSVSLINDETSETSYTFSEPNASTSFTAYMLSSDGQYLTSTDDMSWEYAWSPYYDEAYCDNVAWVDLTAEDDAAEGATATSETQTIQSGEENDQVETVTVLATAVTGWTGSLADNSTVSTFYCDEDESWQYIDEVGNDSYIAHVYPQHFRLIYCDTEDLPTLSPSVQVGGSSDDWFLQYLFISPEDDDDAFGIRVYENPDQLSPSAWYAANVPNPSSGSETTIDGYAAIQDGQSYYVAAANIDTDGADADTLDELYGNIYLITFNDTDVMSDISSQILDYIRFNWNVSYAQCEGSDKDKLIRDTERVTELGEIADLANVYYAEHNEYPYPQSEAFGSYIEEVTSSVWSSWQGALGNLFGETLPEDPYNFFYASDDDEPWDASDTPWINEAEGSLAQDCSYDAANDKFFDETGTCWDPINTKFYCPTNSYTYLWKVDPTNQDDAYLYANLEYSSATTEEYINTTTTQEPCSAVEPDSTCSCFNYVISSEVDPGGTWQ